MKTWVLRFSKGLNLVVLPAMTIAAPTMPFVLQVVFGVVLLVTSHGAVEEWRQPDATRADRVAAAFTIAGLVLSGVLLILMMTSAVYRYVQQPAPPLVS